MKKKKLIVAAIILCIVTIITVIIAKNYVNTDNGKIPFLPLDVNNVNYIGLYGGTHRNATKEEEIQIVAWLNSIKRYEKKYTIPIGNGKPDFDNIQIFTNGNTISFGPDKDGITIASSNTRIGYIVKQSDLSALLEQIKWFLTILK